MMLAAVVFDWPTAAVYIAAIIVGGIVLIAFLRSL